MNKLKVLYIAGWGRSGSTVLANILGQLDGYVSVGELRHVWDRGVLENRYCGCGCEFRCCDFWQSVFNRAFGGMDQDFARRMTEVRDSAFRTRHVPFIRFARIRRGLLERSREISAAAGPLYRAIADASGAEVVVDSSKCPSYAYLLSEHPDIDLYTLHLVRDPRAVAYSWWARSKPEGPNSQRTLRRHHPLRSSLLWSVWNQMLRGIWRREHKNYMLLHYETFAQRPRSVIESICRFINEPRENLPFEGDHEVRLDVCHTVAGNPNRFSTGSVKLRNDLEWQDKLSPKIRWMVWAATLPCRRSFGY